MKDQYRAVVIGGGIVGASVLYHLVKQGWTDIAMIERKELTAGSTWHAAAGFHPLNNDLNISSLQKYTIDLYERLEIESGQQLGIHINGNFSLAANEARWEYLKHAHSVFITMGLETRLMTPDEISETVPILETSDLYGGLYDDREGYLDPHGATVAYVKVAQRGGADVVLRNQVLDLSPRPDGSWNVETEKGTIIAEHVVNAGGLWARKVGAMAGVNLPVTPMQHHYLVTEEIPELAARNAPVASVLDLDGFTYSRQEHTGLLLGVYELNPRHWHVEGAPWDYGMDLIPEEIDRISPQLSKGFERFPVLQEVGIKRWVNGAFTFTPDGNPLVGPVPGLRNFWVACGVMAGFSQGGGVGLSLAQWMVDGEPEVDVYGMDVARYGGFASNNRYLKDTTRQFYSRRFVLTYPNEELPAGRPVKLSPVHDLLEAENAYFGELWGLEVPLYFTPGVADFEESPTLRRSNAFEYVAHEVDAVRNRVGMVDITGFSRFEISGPEAESWLNHLLACRLPNVGSVCLAPMLSHNGRLKGDLTVLRLADDRFWLMGSYYLQGWHSRWFEFHAPASGVKIRNISDEWTGLSICGPKSRDLLSAIVSEDVSNNVFRFMCCREMEIGFCNAIVTRLSVTGELGYEINVPAAYLRPLYREFMNAGVDYDMLQFGFRAMNSMRLEKGFGVWSTEFTAAYTPGMSGLDRFIDFDKGDFIGRSAALEERSNPPSSKLVLLEVESRDADVSGFEPVWCGDNYAGFVTSGGYGHSVNKSLGMAYVERKFLECSDEFSVHVVGEKFPARVLSAPVHDASGSRMRQ